MKKIFIESDLASFEDFHDGEWYAQLFSKVDGTELEASVEDFASHWWGASRSFILPWLYVNSIYDAANSAVPIMETTKQDVWEELLGINAFKGSLWKIAEGSFCAIYYAYENLIVQLLSKIIDKRIRVTGRDFNKVFISVYGQTLSNSLWNSNSISVSREIRNCITHNGGKATQRLLNMKPRPRIENGDVLISASDVRSLWTTLQPLVNKAITESLSRLPARV